MAQIMKRDAKTELKISDVKIANLNPKATPVAHMTGATGFPVNDNDVAALKKYLAEGGTLIIDAAGANSDFKNSAEKLVSAAAGALTEIPLDSTLYNGTIPDSTDVTKAEYRSFYWLKVGNRTVPQLKGVEMNGRYAIIFSGEDITSGLLGTNTYGILGYSPAGATALARNILLYAATPAAGNQGAGAAAAGK
jgi:hypothetical protein